ncbi:MAG: tyrosine-type recombinase/integrase [Ktedonobacteraceae bacterium]
MSEMISLAPIIRNYLKLKRALGRGYAEEERVLRSLNQFLLETKAVDLTSNTFELWSNTLAHLTPTVRRNRMRIVRNFCIYRSRQEPGCFIPDKRIFPAPHQPIRPHIFTEAQIVCLLRAADHLRPHCWSPLRPQLFRLAIVLLYTTGLRRGELARLTLSDYNKEELTLHVRESKFHKSRYVPLSADASKEIEKYLDKRRRLRLPMSRESSLLWNTFCTDGTYCGEGLGNSIRRIMIAADIRKEDGTVPRVHDFRFTFAVHTLLRWYRAGADVQNKLPILAAYMGHVSIISTEYYLPFVPDLKLEASSQFCRRYGALVQPLGEDAI